VQSFRELLWCDEVGGEVAARARGDSEVGESGWTTQGERRAREEGDGRHECDWMLYGVNMKKGRVDIKRVCCLPVELLWFLRCRRGESEALKS
jgi:hypothetical protein